MASCPQKVNVSEAAVARAREQEANAVLEEHLGVKSLLGELPSEEANSAHEAEPETCMLPGP